MGIKEQEDNLFENWKKDRQGFVEDGVVDENAYLQSKLKLLFVMKEVNDPKGKMRDLRDVMR